MKKRSLAALLILFSNLLFSGSVFALTFELNKTIYVATPLLAPIIFKHVDKYGVDIAIPLAELNQQELCVASNCLISAQSAGAVYQKAFVDSGGKEFIVYYDDEGNVIGSADQDSGGESTDSDDGDTQVGAIAGEFNVGSTGAAEYSIPIELPPGTAGVQPQLSINYNSQGGNGLLGVGWSIGGLSVIHRCPATLAKDGFIDGIDFDNNDRFCLDGQPLIAISDAYGTNNTEYRTELDGFSKIVSYGSTGNGPQYFKVWTKSGDIMEYGNTSDSLINPPLANGTVQPDALCWLLNKVSDSANNYMTFAYFEDETTGENYPLRIDYTGNNAQSLTPYHSVEFTYNLRGDKGTKYIAGLRMDSTKRLLAINVKTDDVLVRYYNANYLPTTSASRSKVNEISMCDGNDSCVPSTEFAWTVQQNSGWALDSSYVLPYHMVASFGDRTEDYGVQYVDLNGDGLNDVIYHRWTGPGQSQKGAYLNTGSGWQYAPEYILPYHMVASFSDRTDNYDVRFIDLNGDGLVDALYHRGKSGGSQKGAFLNTGSGWAYAANYEPPYHFVWSLGDRTDNYGVQLTDLNGDGLPDMIYHRWTGPGQSQKGAYLNTGSGWQYAPEYILPYHMVASFSDRTDNYDVRFIDLNGDGLVDALYHRGKSGGSQKGAFLNTGSGWAYAANYEPPYHFVWSLGDRTDNYGVQLTDLNGDGLPDMIYHRWTGPGQSQKGAYLNTGSGWQYAPEYILPYHMVASFSDRTDNYGVQFADLNGDGLVDATYHRWTGTNQSQKGAYLNTGSGWKYAPQYILPYHMVASFDDRTDDYGVQFADLNGDGLNDVIYHRWTGTNQSQKGAYLNTGSREFIDRAKSGLDISINIDYKPLTDEAVYTKGTAATFPDVDIQSPMYVVRQSRTDNGVGSQNTLNYTYAGAKAHVQGRGFLGFASRTVEDAMTGTKVTTRFRQDFPFTGLVSSTETRRGSRLFSKETNTHAKITTGRSTVAGSTDPVFIYTAQSVAVSNDLDTGDLISTTTTTSTYDAFGNPTVITASTNDVGQPLFVTTTNNTYTNDTNKWHLGRLTQASVTKSLDGVASPTRHSAFEYNAATGFLSKEIIEPGSSMQLMKTYAHDGFGNRISVTTTGANITARTTSTTYDSQGRFALTATNALGHSETREYNNALNKGWGQVTKLTGPNGLSTEWEYDTLGRKIKETRADGTISTMGYAFCGSGTYCPSLANGQTPRYVMVSTSDGAPLTLTYYDAVNRAVLTQTQSFDGTLVSVQTEFDSRARVARTSLPYFGANPNYWTINTYDILDRITEERSPATGSTTYHYNGLQTTLTNALGQDMTEMKNSRGQTLWSDDEQGNRVTFTYDAAGNLQQVSDGTNITSNSYDLRGFKMSMNDPDMGQWSYTYNVLGELISQTNANNQTTSMVYDSLGRLASRTEPEGVTNWNYDSASKGIGKLASVVQYGGYVSTQSYDALGRPDSTSTTITGVVYTTSTTYDSVGRVDEITYPTGFSVKQQYTALGYLEKVVNAQSTSTEYWQALATDEFGNVTLSTVGGILTAKDYEDESGRLFDINSGIGQVQNLSYRYDNLGNLTERKDDLQNKTENFVYDTLNRLTSASVQGVGTKTFAYDAMGNITNKSDVGSYLYGENTNGHAGPHAVTTTSNGNVNTTYAYDSNGNMQSGNGRTIAWSSYNKPTQISKGNNVVSFNYGPDRARYQQVASDNTSVKTTTYIGGLFEKIQTGSNIESKHYIRAGGQVIAIHNTYRNAAAATQFLHRDHLGSVDVITDANQNVTERLSFDAFGQRRQTNWNDAISQITSSTTRGYTGHEQLDSVGLIHMNGRVYDPQLGRFLSADPFVQEPKNFQSLNRYTYVQNNPLSYTDPSGFFFKKLKKAFKKAVKSITNAVKSVVSKVLQNQFLRTILVYAAAYYVCGTESATCVKKFSSIANSIATAAGNYTGGLRTSDARVSNVSPTTVPLHGSVGASAKPSNNRKTAGQNTSTEQQIAELSNAGTGDGKFQNGARSAANQYLYNEVAGDYLDRELGTNNLSDENVRQVYKAFTDEQYHELIETMLVNQEVIDAAKSAAIAYGVSMANMSELGSQLATGITDLVTIKKGLSLLRGGIPRNEPYEINSFDATKLNEAITTGFETNFRGRWYQLGAFTTRLGVTWKYNSVLGGAATINQ